MITGNEHTRGATIVVYVCCAITLITLVGNFSGIFKKPSDSEAGEKVVTKDVLVQTFCYFFVVALLQSLAYIGDAPLIDQWKLK
jgi:hypothetical protein